MEQITPPVMDDRGNLSIHTQQGARISFKFADSTGQPLNMSARAVWFEVSNATRLQLINGSTASEKILVIPQGTFNSYVNKAVPYVILDETDTIHELLKEGQLTVRGWV